MKRVDLEALRRAIAMARASDPLRAEQLAAKLESDPWIEVALFAAQCCQCDALHLRSWQPPPCWMGDEKPIDDMPLAGRVAAWELRRRLIAAGLSAFEPDPVAALHARSEMQAAAA